MTRRMTTIVALGALTLGGCAVINQVLGVLAELELLGILPETGFSDPSSASFGKARLSLGARNDDGGFVVPGAEDIEIINDDGSAVDVGASEEVPGHDKGSFLLLVDGSGSVEADLYCPNCPTDPDRLRVEATKALATELGTCGEWRMALLEFGLRTPTAPMTDAELLADWTTDASAIVDAADGLSSGYGTPLWDATWDALDTLSREFESGAQSPDAGVGLVVVSDGADTESELFLDGVIAHANGLGIPVHTVGFGPASDSVDSPDTTAVDGLRRLAAETGGYYGTVASVDDLPVLTEAIAGTACGGYSDIVVTFEDPPTSGEPVSGLVRLKQAPVVSVPFRFRAP